MDWLTFISEMAKAIAWPSAIIIAAIIFRNPLLKLLPELKRLKWKDVEFEFEKEVLKAKAELPQIQMKIQHTPLLIGDDYEERLLRLLEISPKAAVLEAWSQVEQEALDLLKRKDVKVQKMLSPLQILEILLRHNFINKQGQTLYNVIRKLRNKAVHEHETEISENAAFDYISMASEMIRILRDV